MSNYALDDNHDVFLRAGSLVRVSGSARVAQSIRTRLLFYLGEWFLNQADGTPWEQRIFEKGTSLSEVDAILRARILQTDGVVRILSYESRVEAQARRLVVEFDVETSEGDAETVSVSLGGAT